MRFCTRSVLLAAASFLTVSAAQAGTSDIEDNSSRGTSSLKWQTRQTIVGPTTDKLGDDVLAVQVSMNLDPPQDASKPMLQVDMPKGVIVGATWSDSKSIELSVIDDGTADATLSAEHTLAPHVAVFLDAFGFKFTYDYAAGTLIGFIPGSAWNYDAMGSKSFAPWGFTPASLTVYAPALADAQLFSIAFPKIGGTTPLGGQLAVNATTSPTFTYATTEVGLNGGAPITTSGGKFKIPTTDDDFLDIPAVVKGTISYSGDLLVRPSVTITSIGDFVIPFPLTLDLPMVGVDLPYASAADAPIAVAFPTTRFHIPLPNVKITDKSVDLGNVEIGKTVTKQAEIKNSGEMRAALNFESSDPQFVVVSAKETAAPKDKYDLDVKFTPANEGLQTAEITVTSNDPNEPSQIIKVKGIGSPHPTPPAPVTPPDQGPPPQGDGNDGGCGCHTTPTGSDAAGFAVAGLALATILARRRRS